MLKAGSLSYTIVVSIIVAIICTMMILLAYMNRTYFIQTDWHDKLRDNAHSGISIGLASAASDDFKEWKDLFEESSDSVWIKKRRWGAYEMIYSSAQHGNFQFDKTAIKAYVSKQADTIALWLTDRNRPLQISGQALLKGDCVLPKKGLDRAYIEGKNYTRKELIYGNKSVSNSKLLKLDEGLTDYWSKYLKKGYGEQDSVVDASRMIQSLSHSFANQTLIYHSSDEVDLSGVSLAGNIIISSAKSIKLGSEAKLDQVMLIAPTVWVEKGSIGSFHIVASDTLTLEKNLEIQYPSSIIMSNPKDIPYLKINEGVQFNGCIISTEGKSNRRTNNLSIEIHEKATIKGQVYCEGNLEHMGRIEGTVIANNFLLATPSGIYENHLLNGEIDRSGLSRGFGGLAIEGWENKSKTVEWLEY